MKGEMQSRNWATRSNVRSKGMWTAFLLGPPLCSLIGIYSVFKQEEWLELKQTFDVEGSRPPLCLA